MHKMFKLGMYFLIMLGIDYDNLWSQSFLMVIARYTNMRRQSEKIHQNQKIYLHQNKKKPT